MSYITQTLLIFVFMGVLALSSFGCQSGPVRPVVDAPADAGDLTPIPFRDDVEADLLALLFSGEMIAPQSTYLTISAELRMLRSDLPDSLDFLRSIRFSPRESFDMIQLVMGPEARELVRRGEYSQWDSLNSEFDYKFVDTFVLPAFERFEEYMSVTLGSTHRLNPFMVGEKYEKLDGVEAIGISGMGGDSPSLYFGIYDNRKFFLIRDAWGDCPSGCMSARYYLFSNQNNRYTLKERWPSQAVEELPQWLVDAKRGILSNYDADDLRGVPYELFRIPGPP